MKMARMKIYVGNMGSIAKRKIIESTKRLGQFISPGGVTPNRAGDSYGMDNGAYGAWIRGEGFNVTKFKKILNKCRDGYLKGTLVRTALSAGLADYSRPRGGG